MVIGTFEAYAVPMLGASVVDHTYVVIGGTYRFGCHGRDAGGVVIESGVGDVDFGVCLSGINGEAGVEYGISGVCHQAANRILLPARVDVLRARGARSSMFLWGIFGRQGHRHFSPQTFPWPELTSCVAVHGGP